MRKKDGINRICIDYRRLNKISIFDPEPMVIAEDLFRKLSEDKFFTKLDLSKGYWQIPVARKDVHKTAFVTPDGKYEFVKMPFGMVNAGATLMKAMRRLLGGMKYVDNIMDDILVHTKTWEEHVETLKELFQRLSDCHFTARPSKCVIGTDNVDYIGHHVGKGEIGLHEDNVAKIRDAPRPETKTQVRSFLGLTGYYRNFIPNYAAIAVPLTDLTKKGQPNKVVWDEAQERAYQSLKKVLTSKPILQLPSMNKQFILRTDASDCGIGAVLLQENDGEVFPVSYASKKLSESEKRYSAMERECLAIVWGIKKFMLYLYGKEFILQTDHQPLVYIDKAKFANDRIMRWAMILQNYRFRVVSIKGSDNVGADYLSRVV